MRAFFAVELPEAVQAELARLQCELAGTGGADVKWVEAANLHVTMRFLGEITDAQRQELEAGARRVAAGLAPFQAALAHIGAFPSGRAPRVIWAGIEQGKDPLAKLAAGLEDISVAAGLAKEERGFVAHVTLGRTRSSNGLSELARALTTTRWSAPPAFRVEAVTLFQSLLQSSGPRDTARRAARAASGTQSWKSLRDFSGPVYTALARLPLSA